MKRVVLSLYIFYKLSDKLHGLVTCNLPILLTEHDSLQEFRKQKLNYPELAEGVKTAFSFVSI